MYTTSYLAAVFLLCPYCSCWYPRVVTPQGPVVGRTDVSRDGRQFYMFEGIPYAQPPTGDRRFKPPQPADSWEEDFDAVRAQIVCQQSSLGHDMGIEDCLVLNVYTPELMRTSPPMSVIVYIHGGNFNYWTSARLLAGGPEYFMDEDIVLVTINYRLGVFGFLSTEDEEAPGNYGLLDQIEALKWIQRNIASFGGDPNSVTIFGISAGGASAHLHMASPLAAGLFHRVVSQSGTALSGFCRGSKHKDNAIELASMLECPLEPSKSMMDCLRNKDSLEIIEAVKLFMKERHDRGETILDVPIPWRPRTDPESHNPYMPVQPIQAFSSGYYSQVPVIFGNSKDEITYQKDLPIIHKELERLYSNWSILCIKYLKNGDDIMESMGMEEVKEMCDQVYEKYLKPSEGIEAVKLFAFGGILHGIHKAVEIMLKQDHNIYYYSLEHYSEDQSVFNVFFPGTVKTQGAVHCNDFILLFTYPMIRLDEKEERISRNYISFLTSFAKFGVPKFPDDNVDWIPTSAPDYLQLRFDQEPCMQKKDMSEDFLFWDNLFEKLWVGRRT